MPPKASINDKVYKVFCTTFSEAPKRCVANGFLMFCYVVEGCQIIVKNLVLFLMILDAVFAFGLKKHQ